MKRYRIKKGDTLESIAKQLELTYAELRYFHNQHCELYELLGDKIPPSLKEILYQTKEEVVQREFVQIDKESSFELIQKHYNQPITYEVKVSFYEGEKEDNLRYTLQMQWLKINLVQINRTNFYINYKEANLLVDELAVLVSAVVYPLDIYLDFAGCMTSVSNFDEIKKRWEENKPKIKSVYKGKYADQYIAAFEHSLSDLNLFNEYLKKDWFLKVYFTGLYRNYSVNSSEEEDLLYFPVLPSVNSVEYKVRYNIETLEEDDEKLFKIELKGELSDERTIDDFESESNFPLSFLRQTESSERAKGGYRALYFIEPLYHSLDSLYMECTLELEKTKKIYVTASRSHEINNQ